MKRCRGLYDPKRAAELQTVHREGEHVFRVHLPIWDRTFEVQCRCEFSWRAASIHNVWFGRILRADLAASPV